MTCSKPNQRSYSDGFSYIEVLVSLLIISLIGSLLFFSYSISVRSVDSSRKKVKTELLRIKTDSQLRKTIEKISIPSWTSEYEYNMINNTIELSWVDGKENPQLLELDRKVEPIELKPLKFDDGHIVGFIIRYLINGTEYETVAVFASRPYGKEEI